MELAAVEKISVLPEYSPRLQDKNLGMEGVQLYRVLITTVSKIIKFSYCPEIQANTSLPPPFRKLKYGESLLACSVRSRGHDYNVMSTISQNSS